MRKLLLEPSGLQGEVEISVEHNSLVVRATRKPREGWADAFRKMAMRGDHAPIDAEVPTVSTWDEDEREWQ